MILERDVDKREALASNRKHHQGDQPHNLASSYEDPTLFNDKMLDITMDSVKELLSEYRFRLTDDSTVDQLADRITRLAYLNLSLGFTKSSKMMAYVIIEHEKKIEKLQDMCLKLEKLAEHYRSRLTDVLEETKHKIEEFQVAFRSQETELERLKGPIETYDYTLDRISRRFDLIERSIDSISERPSNIHIAHLLPPATKQIDYKRNFSLNVSQSRHNIEEEGTRLLGRVAGQNHRSRQEVLRQKAAGMASNVMYDHTDWLGGYLQERSSAVNNLYGKRVVSGRYQSDRGDRGRDVIRNLDSELSQRPGQFLDAQQAPFY